MILMETRTCMMTKRKRRNTPQKSPLSLPGARYETAALMHRTATKHRNDAKAWVIDLDVRVLELIPHPCCALPAHPRPSSISHSGENLDRLCVWSQNDMCCSPRRTLTLE